MRLFILLLFLLPVSVSGFATPHPTDSINFDQVNVPYLEKLVKFKIDSIRHSLGLNSLQTDITLYKAARDHAIYLKNRRTIGHFQNNHVKKTAFKRAMYYGADQLKAVGENVAWNAVERLAEHNKRTGKTSYRYFYTYDRLANALVEAWLTSLPHYQTLKRKDFDYTAVSIAYDQVRKEFTCVQVFAEYFENSAQR